MRALALDTSTHRAEALLFEDGVCVAREQNTEPSRHAESILMLIDKAFETSAWSKSQIDVVVPCLGPGSFTGVRIALATAKGIALALGKPIIGVSGLEAMAFAFGERARAVGERADAVVAVLDARKGEVFWGAYEPDGRLLSGPGHVPASRIGDIFTSLPRRVIVVGEMAERLDLARVPNVRVHRSPETDLPDAFSLARLGIEILARRGPDDLDALEPIYLRPPDITLPKTK